MAKNHINSNHADSRNWSGQFNELNMPAPDHGAFGWRKQQLAMQRASELAAQAQESGLPGPNLLQRLIAYLRRNPGKGAARKGAQPAHSSAAAK